MSRRRVDPVLVGTFLVAAVWGWLVQHTTWYDDSFTMYALALATVGFVGAAVTGNLFVAPAGLLLGQYVALLRAPRLVVLDLLVIAAALSIPLLAGLVGRAVRRRPDKAE